jgi:aspartyl-tRNA(Asn)/glutamyl-tRNA(Gln) amidotransferase subunit A
MAGGLAGFARALRAGEITCADALERYLDRIEQDEPRIGAFEYVATETARQTAVALDRLIGAGTDLGPLMGMPVAIKDIFSVEGMPTSAGSKVDVADLIGPEGSFVRRLRSAGCIIIGRSRTVEFALGSAGGVNRQRGTPRNPNDTEGQRVCGGSSSGSAAALAAGMCAFSIGSDTGGSVRIPAAFCGLVGFKPTTGLWPTDGVFPLCETLDTIGPLTRTIDDAALIFTALEGVAVPTRPVSSLRFGLPTNQFVEDLDPAVATAFDRAIERLEAAGATISRIEIPDLGVPEDYFHSIVPAEFMASVGRDRFQSMRDELGFDVAARGDTGLTLLAEDYVAVQRRRQRLAKLAHQAINGFDAWLTPTIGLLAPRIEEFDDSQKAIALSTRIGRLTRPANLFDFCSLSLPIPTEGLPVGLQIMAPRDADAALLAVAGSIDRCLKADTDAAA